VQVEDLYGPLCGIIKAHSPPAPVLKYLKSEQNAKRKQGGFVGNGEQGGEHRDGRFDGCVRVWMPDGTLGASWKSREALKWYGYMYMCVNASHLEDEAGGESSCPLLRL
jgi:hypothetical protein